MNSLNKKQITGLLPHREPMLLIDELYDIKKLFSATAVVNVYKDSFFDFFYLPKSSWTLTISSSLEGLSLSVCCHISATKQ